MTRITIATSAAEMEQLCPLWEKIAAQRAHAIDSGEVTPRAPADARYTLFQSFDWNLEAARAFIATERPHVIAVQDANGAAIIPACIRRQGSGHGPELSLLGEELFDYRCPIATHASALAEAFAVLAQQQLPIRVVAVRDGNSGFFPGFILEPFAGAPRILRAESPNFYHAKLGRMLRRLQRGGCMINTRSSADVRILTEIYRLKTLQPNGALFTDPARVRMICNIAMRVPGQIEVFTLESGSTLVAALIALRDHSVRRFYTTYFNEAWAKDSPGIALLHEVARQSLAAGLDCDLMTGQQPYKMRLATSEVPLFTAVASASEIRKNVASQGRAFPMSS